MALPFGTWCITAWAVLSLLCGVDGAVVLAGTGELIGSGVAARVAILFACRNVVRMSVQKMTLLALMRKNIFLDRNDVNTMLLLCMDQKVGIYTAMVFSERRERSTMVVLLHMDHAVLCLWF